MSLMSRLADRRELPPDDGRCTNGGCTRPPSHEVRIGMRETDWRKVCGACAESLSSLYPEQRPLPGVPAWVARMDRNAKVLRTAA